MKRALAIVTDIVTGIKAIRAANGYSADVTASDVTIHRTSDVPADKTECINILTAFNNSATDQSIKLTIELGCKKGAANFTFMMGRIYDINLCLANLRGTLKTKYGYLLLKPVAGEKQIIAMGEAGKETFFFEMEFSIDYEKTEKWDINTGNY